MTKTEEMKKLLCRLIKNVKSTHETLDDKFEIFATRELVSLKSMEDAEFKMLDLIYKSLNGDMKFYAKKIHERRTIIYIMVNNNCLGKLEMVGNVQEIVTEVRTTTKLIKEDTFETSGYKIKTTNEIIKSIKIYTTRVFLRLD